MVAVFLSKKVFSDLTWRRSEVGVRDFLITRDITSRERGHYGSIVVVSLITLPSRKTFTATASPGLRLPMLLNMRS